MADQGDPLARIADALERLAPCVPAAIDWTSHPAYVWHGGQVRQVAAIEAVPLDRLKGIDRQKQAVTQNVARIAAGHAAHDMLLWGARGMGKSALLRAAVVAEQASGPQRLALIQLDAESLAALPDLFDILSALERNFLLYLDDLAFDRGNASCHASCGKTLCERYAHGATPIFVNPASSGSPNATFSDCTACPAVPRLRLSMAANASRRPA